MLGGAAWPPYVLRGAGVGETSWNNTTNWTGASFKISGRLLRTSATNPNAWVPLRYFTFKDNSFDPTNFTSKIEIVDMYKPRSLGYWQWIDAFEQFGYNQIIGLFWMIDEKNQGYQIEDLKTENYYGD